MYGQLVSNMAGESNGGKVELLKENLMEIPDYRYEPLLEGAKLTKQHHVVDMLSGASSGSTSEYIYTEAPHLSYESKLRFPQSVVLGETFMVHVKIHGLPTPEITWLHNDRPLTNSDGVTIQTTERYSKLEITNMKDDEMGKYVVQAKNSSGFFTANYEVRKRTGSEQAGQGLTDPIQALNPPDTFGVHVTNKKTVIQNSQSSIILTVPEGAVAEGETCTITGQIHTDLHNYQHLLEPEHYFITPIIEYEASSDILQPVEIQIPHCLHGQDLVKHIRVFFSHKDNKVEINEDAKDGHSFKVEENEIIIQTMKFGRFYCECSGIPTAFPIHLDLWMTHKLYTSHHVVTLQPVLRLGLVLQKDFNFMKESHTYDKSRLIMTKPADGIGQRWEPVVNFFQEQSNNKWKEWKSSAHMEFNAALLDLKLPSSYITSLPDICLSSKTGGQLNGILNIKLADPKSSKCREISVRVDEEVTSSDYTESPPQLLHLLPYKQSRMIKVGEDLRLELKLAGKPLPEVNWFHNKKVRKNGGNISIRKSQSNTVLEIKKAVLCDAGWYQVKARNYLGYYETKIQVLVYEKQAEQETLMADRFHMRTPDIFGVNLARQETMFLQHPQSSVILTVPRGACPEDAGQQKYTVSCQVHTDLNNFTHLLEPEHCFIAPIIRYKTNIEQFLQPVEIELRHCLALEQDKNYVKVSFTTMGRKKTTRKYAKRRMLFDFDNEFIKLKTLHFCLLDCQAHQQKCSFKSLVSLFMSITEGPHERIIGLAPIIYIGCLDIKNFEDEIKELVDPDMWLVKRRRLNLPGNLSCSKARTTLAINMSECVTFVGGGGSKECSVTMTKILLPCINSLPEYVLRVPLEAVYLRGELKIDLCNDAGEDVHTSIILREKMRQEADKATPTAGKATSVHLYQQACKSGTVSTCQSHIVVFGHEGAGKSSLVRCLLGQPFVEDHIETNLLDTHKAIVDEKAEKWEDLGEDARTKETQILVAAKMKELDEEKQREAVESRPFETTTRTSTETAWNSPDEESGEAERGRIRYGVMRKYQQKGGDDFCVTLWDFAGQSIFYTLHQMFLTQNTIYLVVNDLTFSLDDILPSDHAKLHEGSKLTTQRGLLNYILRCIEARKHHDKKPAKLIAVCTKSDRSELTDETRAERIAAVEDHLKSKGSPKFEVRAVYAFSSKHPDVNLTKLKEELKTCIKSHETKIPIKWILFRDKLKTKSHRTWSDVCDIAEEEGIEGENMVRAALWFLHDQGEVIFFPEKQLSNFVITQPEWFIELVKKVITLEKYQDTTNISLDQWKELNTRGIVHEDILTECWGENKDNMITLMRAFLMLAPWSKDPKDNSKQRFVIPSLLPYKSEKDFPCDWTLPPIYVRFQTQMIPLGFTSSLLVILEFYSQILAYSEDGSAFCNAAMFRRRGHDVWLKEVNMNGQDLLQVSGHPKTQTRALSKRRVEEDTVAHFLDDIRQRIHDCQLIRHIPQGHQLLIPCQCGQHFMEIPDDGAITSYLQCPHDAGTKSSTTEYKVWFKKDDGTGEAPHLCYESKLRYPQSVSMEETFMIHVKIHGSPAPDITWLHNDRTLTNGNGVTILTTEQYSKLEITNNKDEDFGKYVVQAKNSSGFFTANYEVRKSCAAS